jgi:hypothetical protein
MTDTEINVAIAKLTGWQDQADKYPCGEWGAMPNYCGSLDAMHNAENLMLAKDPSLRQSYQLLLIEVCDEDPDFQRHYWNSTACQRAEAFLRVHGKWID